MKKSVPGPLTQQLYTHHPPYGYSGGPDPMGRTPSPRARRRESLLIFFSPTPSARRPRWLVRQRRFSVPHPDLWTTGCPSSRHPGHRSATPARGSLCTFPAMTHDGAPSGKGPAGQALVFRRLAGKPSARPASPLSRPAMPTTRAVTVSPEVPESAAVLLVVAGGVLGGSGGGVAVGAGAAVLG